MERIPTAKEMMQSKNGDDYTHWEEIHDLMISFAKLHVQAALEAAAENARAKENPADYGTGSIWVDKSTILSAYPPINIK